MNVKEMSRKINNFGWDLRIFLYGMDPRNKLDEIKDALKSPYDRMRHPLVFSAGLGVGILGLCNGIRLLKESLNKQLQDDIKELDAVVATNIPSTISELRILLEEAPRNTLSALAEIILKRDQAWSASGALIKIEDGISYWVTVAHLDMKAEGLINPPQISIGRHNLEAIGLEDLTVFQEVNKFGLAIGEFPYDIAIIAVPLENSAIQSVSTQQVDILGMQPLPSFQTRWDVESTSDPFYVVSYPAKVTTNPYIFEIVGNKRTLFCWLNLQQAGTEGSSGGPITLEDGTLIGIVTNFNIGDAKLCGQPLPNNFSELITKAKNNIK